MPQARALSTVHFAQAIAPLGPFERRPHLAVAVSGGADSMALVLLAADWARARGGRVTALTVDHGLRREAASEAKQVGRWLNAHGIAHEILRWRGAKPATGVQAAARDARYDLLEAWCRANDVLHLLLAHHRDDQAETARLRADSGSGPLGRAGMSRIVEREHVRLLRPLLTFPKVQLIATLSARAQDWIDDPFNRDARFARARLRAEGASESPPQKLGEQRAALESQSAAWLSRAVDMHPAGWAWLDPALLRGARPEAIELGLGRLLTTIGGAVYAPASEAVQRVIGWLHENPTGGGRTLGGCRLAPGGGRGRILVCREAGRIVETTPLRPGRAVLWDGRLRIEGGRARGRVVALGTRRIDGWDVSKVPAAARAALPCVALTGRRLGVGLTGTAAPSAVGRFRAVFQPRRPLASAIFAPPNGPGRRKKSIV